MVYEFERSIGKLSQEVSHNIGALLVNLFRKRGYEVSSPEWIVLAYLNQYEVLNQNNISNVVLRDKVFVKRLLDKMEEDQLIQRRTNAMDNRYNDISLTQKGKILFLELSKIAEQTLEYAYKGLRKNELERGIEFLKKVNENLFEELEE